ncbi:MAG: hypothetical protein IJ680_01475, partial [Paludibacteraceae bacterium]|nr:hypothetical protein [Paludibacteraceae bacterium]
VCGKIYNNTIANNEDGALNVNNGSNLIEIVNNVMFGSDAETTGKVNVGNNANLTFTNNATVKALTASNATTADNIVISTDNTGSDDGVLYAAFTDPDNGNFKLTKKSALVDNGKNISAVTTDIDKQARPLGSTYDIGAYERPVTYTLDVTFTTPIENTLKIAYTDLEGTAAEQQLDNAGTMQADVPATSEVSVSIIRSTFRSAIESILLNEVEIDNIATRGDTTFTLPLLTADSRLNITMNQNTVTGLKENTADFGCIGMQGMIRIENAVSRQPILVYKADGQLLQRIDNAAADLNIAATAGLYIVRCGEEVRKVIVR